MTAFWYSKKVYQYRIDKTLFKSGICLQIKYIQRALLAVVFTAIYGYVIYEEISASIVDWGQQRNYATLLNGVWKNWFATNHPQKFYPGSKHVIRMGVS